MPRFLLFLVLALGLLVVPALAYAGDEEPAPAAAPDRVLRPFLWVIPGEVPSYLFGTAHTVDERVTTLHPAAQRAFDACGAAYFEVDFIKDGAAQLAAMRLPPGKTTAAIVPADLLARLDARLTKIHPMLSRAQLGELKPVAWSVIVPTLHEQMKKPGTPVLDAKLYGAAMQAGKEVGGLEKPEEQVAFLDTIKDEEAVLMLRVMLDQWDAYDAKGEDPVSDLINHYLRGDERGLLAWTKATMAADEIPEDLEARLMQGALYERNERIAKAIAKRLQASPKKGHFFAVGAMHLLGEGRVQGHLEKLGILAKRAPVGPEKAADGARPPAKLPEEEPEPAGAR